jgi:hypothetical protein
MCQRAFFSKGHVGRIFALPKVSPVNRLPGFDNKTAFINDSIRRT